MRYCDACITLVRLGIMIFNQDGKVFYGIDGKADSHHHIPALQE